MATASPGTICAPSNISADRQRPCRRQSGGAAGRARRQRLRGARPLLSRRHPEHAVKRTPSARGNVRLCGVLLRRPRCAVPSGAAVSQRHGTPRDDSATARAGSSLPPTRASTRRRPARPHAVQRRPCCRAGGARPDVADPGARRCRRRRAWISDSYSQRDQQATTTSARWRCSCSSAGCRAAATDERSSLTDRLIEKGAVRAPYLFGSAGLDIQIDPDRHVVGRLLPGRGRACRCRRGQPVGGLRRQQQVVDADAVVLLPGAGLIVPERVEAGVVA